MRRSLTDIFFDVKESCINKILGSIFIKVQNMLF